MTVARESRRGGARVAPDSASAAAAAQARSAEIQRQLNLTISEKKHFELVCEIKPDWNDSEIVSFLQKCNYNASIINDALINAFEDLRPGQDQNAVDWNVQSKKSKRKQKEKVAMSGEQQSSDRRRSGPRDRPERSEPRDRTEKFERRERPDRRDRKERPNVERRPKRDYNKAEGAVSKLQPQWASSSGDWGEAQSTLPSDVGAWGSLPLPSDVGSLAEPSAQQPEPIPESDAVTDAAAPSMPETSSSNQDATEGVPSPPPKIEENPTPSTCPAISWAGITKRSLAKSASSPPTKIEQQKPAAEPEAKPSSPSGWGSQEAVGQWGAPEPALAADVAIEMAAEVPAAEPEREPTPTTAEPVTPTPPSQQAEVEAPSTGQPSTEDLLAASEPVILPQFVSQQAAALNPTMIQFGSFSISDETEMVSPNAQFVRIHSAQTDFAQQQQMLQQEHEMASEDVPADIRFPMHAFYPPTFVNSMHSYMPYEADTAYFESYNQQQQQQRVQRPRQQPYNNARNNKMRRDHRNAANNQRQPQPEDFPTQPMAANDQPAHSFAQGVPEREPHGPKHAGAERANTGGPRGNKQRQSDRGRGGLTGAYHHPSYAGGHIPVGYGQPYAYPAPYLPQFYGQNQQGYGPPGFRQHYSQYQTPSNYQQPYQPRSAYMGQTEYVDTAGMHIGQHQGEPGSVSKQSESEHVSPDPSVLYPFEHQPWPDQHRYIIQQQQPHQTPNNESTATEPAAEGSSIQHCSFDRRGDGSSSQPASFGYGGQQYSPAHSYQNFSNQHQYNDSSNRAYHWASHQ